MTGHPPRLATWLLRRCLPDDPVGASILGDLREEYEQDVRWKRVRYVVVALALATRYAVARAGPAVTRRFHRGDRDPGGRTAARIVVDDARDAWRGLRRRPLFVAAGVGLLACGLAATSIVASFVDAVLVRPLPMVQDLSTLVRIQERVANPGPDRAPFRNVLPADMERIAAAAPSLVATAAMLDGGSISIAAPEGARRVPVARTTGGFFDVLGVQPAIGRRFGADDEQPGRPLVAVLSHAGWERLFGGRTDAIGSVLTLNQQPHTIIGIMPQGFTFPDGPDLYVPLTRSAFTNRFHVATGLARVRAGIPMARVRAEVDAAVASLAADEPGAGHGSGARVRSWREAATERVQPAMQILAAAAAVVLVLAAANLAGLLADRTLSRARELAVRRSLGATDAAVMRLLIAEGVILSGAGAIVGLGVAALALGTVVSLSPADLPFRAAVRLDVRIVTFTGLTAMIAGIGAGVVPALRSRHRGLASGERSGPSSGAARSGRVLVVAQIAAAMVLVCGAALLIRSFVTALRVDPGVRVEGILTAGVTLGGQRYDDQRQRRFFEDATEALRRVPGVTSAELSLFAPLSGAMPVGFSRQPGDDHEQNLFLNAVSPGLLPLLRIPVLEGRGFVSSDDERRERVALVSRLGAATLFHGESPLGRTLHRGQDAYRIVGIVADVRQEGPLEEPRPMIYVPFRQFPFSGGTFVLTADTDPAAMYSSLRTIVERLDPMLPLDRTESLASLVDRDLAQPRFYSVVVGLFGALALGLAVSGLYAVIAFATTRRMFEFGVRSALGARPIDNLWMVYRQGLALALTGVAIGTVLAVQATGLLRSLLYRTEPGDPATLIAAACVTLVVTLIAVITPAMRAARVDPVTALRVE